MHDKSAYALTWNGCFRVGKPDQVLALALVENIIPPVSKSPGRSDLPEEPAAQSTKRWWLPS
jgi:hypothetical protein